MSRKSLIVFAVIWFIAMLIAMVCDYPFAQWVHSSGFGRQVEGKPWAQVIKEPGEFRFTVVVAVLLIAFRQINWKQGLFITVAGVVSGTNALVKWIVGRSRPYKLTGTYELKPFTLHPFWHGLNGLFHQTNLCFPSGHACTAFALAASMWLVWRRGAWAFILLAIGVGLERPAENAHYLSDVVGAVGFGVLGSLLLHKLLASWMTPNPPGDFEIITE